MLMTYDYQGANTAERNRIRIKRTGLTPNGSRVWTEEEDNILRQHYPNFKKIAKILKCRTYRAVRARSVALNVSPKKKPWLASEVQLLRRHYGKCSREQLMAMFPGFSRMRIASKATHMGLQAPRRPLKITGHVTLDAIRTRSQQLKLSMVDLDEISGSGRYFQHNNWGKKEVDWNCLCRAIRALDGLIKIEWRD